MTDTIITNKEFVWEKLKEDLDWSSTINRKVSFDHIPEPVRPKKIFSIVTELKEMN